MRACRIATRPMRSSCTSGCSASGFLFRDCQRLINQDRNHFAASMVALGDADAMVTGATRNYSTALSPMSGTSSTQNPATGSSASRCAWRAVARSWWPIRRSTKCRPRRSSPRSRSNPPASRAASATSPASRCCPSPISVTRRPSARRRSRQAVEILDGMRVDFEYDGEMSADVALNRELMVQYPFSRLTGPANVLVMPAFHSASISTKMLQELGGAMVLGPHGGRASTGRSRSCPSARPMPTSSTWRRWPPTISEGSGRASDRRYRRRPLRNDKRKVRGFSEILPPSCSTSAMSCCAGTRAISTAPSSTTKRDGMVPVGCVHATTGIWSRIAAGTGTRRWRFSPRTIRPTRSSIRAFHERWEETVTGPIEENVALLSRLRARGRPELLHHQFLEPEIRAVAGALSVPHGFRRHRRVG